MGLLKQLRQCWRSDFLSPKDFMVWAVVISLLFLAAHLAGLREFTSVLNGTVGSVDMGWEKAAMLGIVYILLYLAFVLCVPILILAAAISAAIGKLVCHNQATNEPRANTPSSN